MRLLRKAILVEFHLFDAEEVSIPGSTSFAGANGVGKTTLLDAIQIAMLGAHGNYLSFNAQATGAHIKARSVRDYCLGTVAEGETKKPVFRTKRTSALTYITLVFADEDGRRPVSVGCCLSAHKEETGHAVMGLYVLPDVALSLSDHIERQGENLRSLPWATFEAQARRMASEAGATPTFTTKSTAYIGEMLHALQPSRERINPTDFARTFQRSLTLRDVGTVNEFVRDHLIDRQPIDMARARGQIQEFQRLENLVARVKAMIDQLARLDKLYEHVADARQRVASVDLLVATYRTEHLNDQLAAKQDLHQAKQAAVKAAVTAHSAAKAARDGLRKRVETLGATLKDDPNDALRDVLSNERTTLQESRDSKRAELDRALSVYGRALAAIGAVGEIGPLRTEVLGVSSQLSAARERMAKDDFSALERAIDKCADVLQRVAAPIATRLAAAERAVRQAESDVVEAQGRLRNVQSGGADVKLAAPLIAYLANNSIQARPVCDLIRVKDPQWQPAIEAFLGPNRESLVVEAGRERSAVGLLRRIPREHRPYGLTIVQPAHLKNLHAAAPADDLVASLIEGDDPVALAYVRQIFGGMRIVKDEAGLEEHSRSMTVDGMLSANGGTSSMRLVPVSQLLINRRSDRSLVAQLAGELGNAEAVLARVRKEHDQVSTASKALAQSGVVTPEVLAEATAAIAGLAGQIADVEQRLAGVPQGKMGKLREEIDAERKRLKNADEAYDASVQAKAVAETELSNAERELGTLQAEVDKTVVLEKERRGDPDAHPLVVDAMRREFDVDQAGRARDFDTRMELCARRRKAADQSFERNATGAATEFARFLLDQGKHLPEESADWRKAAAWVRKEHGNLQKIELVKHEGDAKKAREAAEKSFRQDIAFRIRDAIRSMQQAIKDVNTLLKGLPPFTNDEQYEFKWDPAPTFEGIYKEIMAAGDDTSLALEDSGGGVSRQILDLLLSAESMTGDAADNPLRDYRVMFNFDVRILRQGKEVGWLSHRMGPGSGGEHLAPFYVIAGAALASVYRIHWKARSDGFGLMLLDEAFKGMDEQNSMAAGKFLQSLGLQLVMAAPASQFGLLAPVSDAVYTVIRFDLDASLSIFELNERGRELMVSDFPSQHPELLQQAMTFLGGAQGSTHP